MPRLWSSSQPSRTYKAGASWPSARSECKRSREHEWLRGRTGMKPAATAALTTTVTPITRAGSKVSRRPRTRDRSALASSASPGREARLTGPGDARARIEISCRPPQAGLRFSRARVDQKLHSGEQLKKERRLFIVVTSMVAELSLVLLACTVRSAHSSRVLLALVRPA